MQFFKLLRHLFIPHESNNQKAKLLHSSSLSLLAIGLIAFQLVLGLAHNVFPRVLGYAANISPAEVIRLTNAQRAANGLGALSENSTLDSAALAKGNDMLAKGYWAHFAPDGTSPWSFFLNFGYKYKYAGENLARDFPDASSAVNAWMNSPSHKENILNPNYREIGIGVVEGNLAGVETTVVVQFFGAPLSGEASIPEAKAKEVLPSTAKETLAPSPTPTPIPTPTEAVTYKQGSPAASVTFVSPFASTKNISLLVTGILILILSVDLIIVRRRRIARISGRTLAHLAYFGMILAVILILKAGQII
ncbi:MAG: CAP domain-containing protein [Candidatus Woesebacteria bacterium]|nr:CAP domain-containing protein [Candidatus Woesebacteria bacterium]